MIGGLEEREHRRGHLVDAVGYRVAPHELLLLVEPADLARRKRGEPRAHHASGRTGVAVDPEGPTSQGSERLRPLVRPYQGDRGHPLGGRGQEWKDILGGTSAEMRCG